MTAVTEIYTKDGCPHCVEAKRLLTKHNKQYVEHKIGENGVTKETINAKIGGGAQIRTVPQIFLEGKYVGGCSDLKKLWGEA